MPEHTRSSPTATETGRRWPAYFAIVALTAIATALVMYLWQNITERRQEAQETVFRVVPITNATIDPAEWGKNYPRQFDSYKQTVDIARTRFGGSEAFQRLDEFPRYRILFAGYPFSIDYREDRGHGGHDDGRAGVAAHR